MAAETMHSGSISKAIVLLPLCIRKQMWPDGLAGVRKSGIFRVSAPWVDTRLPPGHSSQTQTLGLRSTLMNIVTLRYLVMSPNLVWLAIAAAIYVVCPYDIPAAGAAGSAAAAAWIAARAAVNFSLCFAYTAFFRVQLYVAPLTSCVL